LGNPIDRLRAHRRYPQKAFFLDGDISPKIEIKIEKN
jgi:hypothetical protein